MKTAIRKFNKLCLSTLIAVYFLIFVGGVVRSTGSGMGCPDWPKCFGRWVPPTSVSQLPPDYKDAYAVNRDKKNKRFASVLARIGFQNTADQLVNDKSILIESDFNATKTWIEYLNRLVGVVVGFMIALLFWKSIKLRKVSLPIFLLSAATLVGVVFQGWFGSIVVSTSLTTWTITVHMFLALLIVVLLLVLYWKSRSESSIEITLNEITITLLICMTFILIQIFFGTQVREGIDRVSASFARIDWVANLGLEFIIHRSFSWAVLALHGFLLFRLQKTKLSNPLSTALIVLILAGVFSGVIMAYFSVPAFIQPVHLLLATLIFGVQILLFLKLNTTSSTLLKD